MARTLTVARERFPIRGTFRIARGARTEAEVVLATIADDNEAGGRAVLGRGEAVPYSRYSETVEDVIAVIEGQAGAVAAGLTREALLEALPPGAARNALDCALFDLEAKLTGVRASERAGVPAIESVTTAFTLSLGSPDEMAAAAEAAAGRPLLKVKLGAPGDTARIRAVRKAAPSATLIVDANEGWHASGFLDNVRACADAGVALIEQPLPAHSDGLLATVSRPVPICADESAHVSADLEGLLKRYDAVNIKLDKTGGLTEALAMKARARELGLKVMVGCMVGTSLAMAPALILAQGADYVDLDGPLLLAKDRDPGLTYEGSVVLPPPPALWG